MKRCWVGFNNAKVRNVEGAGSTALRQLGPKVF
jgi:hypothetical protein